MIKPPSLKAGDKVCIVAPGRKINEESVATAIKTFESWGLNVTFGKNLFNNNHAYLSSIDSERLDDLQQALDDSSIKGIFCARGGYGTTRILDKLTFDSFIRNPKWVVGFSDITALHLQLQKLNIQSVHGIMPILFDNQDASTSIDSLFTVLFQHPENISFEGHQHNVEGSITGELIGGNLSIIVDSLGTRSEIDTSNKILVIEEIDEYVYKIDRMFVQLKRAKKLDNVVGIVVGHMTDIKETNLMFGETISEIINSHCKYYNIPIAFNFPSGHENPNLPWIQGAQATLDVTKEGSKLVYT